MTEELSKFGDAGGEKMAHALNKYFEQIGKIIRKNGGDILKFAGDALLVVWPVTGVGELNANKAAALRKRYSRLHKKEQLQQENTDKHSDGDSDGGTSGSASSTPIKKDTTNKMIDLDFDNATEELHRISVNNIMSAIDCALDIQNEFDNFQILPTVTVKVKLGIGYGKCTLAHLGTKRPYQYIGFGDGILQAFEAEKNCKPGQILICAEAWNKIPVRVRKHYGSKRLSKASSVYKDKNWKFLVINWGTKLFVKNKKFSSGSSFQSFNSTKKYTNSLTFMQLIQKYIPQNVIKNVDNMTWLDENRNACVIFINVAIKLADMSDENSKSLLVLQSIVSMVQTSAAKYDGMVNKFAFDDKGASFLVVFGLPGHAHSDDCTRSVLSALEIYAKLQKSSQASNNQLIDYNSDIGDEHDIEAECETSASTSVSTASNTPRSMSKTKCTTLLNKETFGCSIGISYGPIWCGCLGSRTNREYGVLGDTVNLAARLMQASQIGSFGKVFCSSEVARKARFSPAILFTFDSEIQVKGKSEKIKIYSPQLRSIKERYHAIQLKFDLSHKLSQLQDIKNAVSSNLNLNVSKPSTNAISIEIKTDDIEQRIQQAIRNNTGSVQLISGTSGTGKELFLSKIAQNLTWAGLTHVSYGVNTEHNTNKFDLWCMILRKIIQNELRIFIDNPQFPTVLSQLMIEIEAYLISIQNSMSNSTKKVQLSQKLPVLRNLLLKNFAETEFSMQTGNDVAGNYQSIVEVVVSLLAFASRHIPLVIIIGNVHFQNKSDRLITQQVCNTILGKTKKNSLTLNKVHVIMTTVRVEQSNYVSKKHGYHATQNFTNQLSQNPDIHFPIQPLDTAQTMMFVASLFGVFSVHSDVMKLVMNKCQGYPGLMYVLYIYMYVQVLYTFCCLLAVE